MTWKVATRVLETRQGTIKPQANDSSVVNDIQERFYADYSGGQGKICPQSLLPPVWQVLSYT